MLNDFRVKYAEPRESESLSRFNFQAGAAGAALAYGSRL